MTWRSAGLLIVLTVAPSAVRGQTQTLPPYLRDRGTGVRTSMLGTYVRDGELLIYPFFEWYADHNLEYKPSELGYGLNHDYRGRFRASEGILYFAYGLTPDLMVEFESAVITAELRKDRLDSATVPQRIRESGLGDVEGQIRWRVQRENEHRPEVFTFFETVLPLQRTRHIIGTQDWEFSAGFGLTRGFSWGTMTFRAGAEYTDHVVDAGEYAIEYMRQVSQSWRIITAIEGSQVDEISLLTEVQWRFARNAIIKLNNGWGFTPNATDIAPEVGVMFNF
ncbi:MAG TPA: hypothetical protein VKB63_15795 [Gemmatimonadales bacterium]|nr:hypothetical protein [Gemmatimonadales bacterium]